MVASCATRTTTTRIRNFLVHTTAEEASGSRDEAVSASTVRPGPGEGIDVTRGAMPVVMAMRRPSALSVPGAPALAGRPLVGIGGTGVDL
jgi:hypothetical protein